MAVSAKFIADFASFDQAVKKATSSLNLWEAEIKKVERQMHALDDAFSGRQIIQQATQAAAAVEKIGGATKLTDAEQKRLNATVSEALAKYKALGLEAPKSLQDLEKATRGLEDTTKAASKTTGVLSSAFGQFTAANLAAAAIQNVIGKVGEFIQQGAKLSGIERSFITLSGTVKQSSDEMLSSMRTATRGLVSDLDLMQSANKAVLLGLPVTAQEMGELGKSAVALGRAMGLDATQSMNDLITALGRSSPLILDNLGLTVKVEDANKKYAESLGVTVSALTEADKKMAFYKAAMEAARQKTKELGEQHLTLSEQVNRAWVSFGNDTTRGASTFNKVVGAILSDGQMLQRFFEGWLKGGMLQAIGEVNTELDKLANKGRLPKGSKFRTAQGAKEDADYIADLERMDAKLKTVSASQKAQIAAARALGAEYKAGARDIQLNEKELARLEQTTKDSIKSTKDAGAAAKKAAELQEFHAKIVVEAYEDTRKAAVSYYDIIRKASTEGTSGIKLHGEITAKVLTAEIDQWVKLREVINSIKVVDGLGNLNLPGDVKLGTGGVNLLPEKIVSPFRDAFAQFGRDLPNIIFGALQGGGSVVGSIASGLAVAFGDQFKKALDKVAGDMAKLSKGNKALGMASVGLSSFVGGFGIGESQGKTKGALGGAASGALAGAAFGPWGAAIGAAAGFFGGIFGGAKKAKEELQKLRQAQEDLIKHFGGLEKLKLAAQDTGVALGNALTTKNGAEFQRFVDKLNTAIEGQKERWAGIAPIIGDISKLGGRLPASFQGYIDQLEKGKLLSSENLDVLKQLTGEGELDWQRLQSVAEQYGISLAGLGDKFQTAKLSAGAQQIWDDFQLLIGAGADTNTVLDGMADEFSNMAINAKKFGIALPENFRKLFEELSKSGKLLDENGEKIEDISTMTFGDTIQTSLEKLVDKLDEFLDRLLQIPDAIGRIPKNIDVEVGIRQRDGGDVLDVSDIGSAGMVTRPTLAMVGEQGSAAMSLGGGVGGIVINVTGNHVRDDRDLDVLADRIVRRMPNRLTLAGV